MAFVGAGSTLEIADPIGVAKASSVQGFAVGDTIKLFGADQATFDVATSVLHEFRLGKPDGQLHLTGIPHGDTVVANAFSIGDGPAGLQITLVPQHC